MPPATRLGPILVPLALAASAAADPPGLSVIALSGGPAPGDAGYVFTSFSHAVPLGFRPAFRASARDTDGNIFTGIWGPAEDLSLQLLAREGGIAPGTSGGLFQSLAGREPHVRGTTTLFSADLQPGTGDVTAFNFGAIFRLPAPQSASPIVARIAGAANLSGALFSTIGSGAAMDFQATSAAIPTFTATLAMGPGGVTAANNAGVWGSTIPSGSFGIIAREFDTVSIPGRGSARLSTFDSALASGGNSAATLFRGNVAFLAGGSADALLIGGGTLAVPVGGITSVGGNTVGSFVLPAGTVSAINTYAIGGAISGSQTHWLTVVTSSTGVQHLYNNQGRLLSSDLTTPSGARFTSLDSLTASPGSAVAFRARLLLHPSGPINTTNDDCIASFRTTGSIPVDPSIIAREGGQAPGCPAGTLFDVLSPPAINASEAVVFAADLRPGTGDVTSANLRGIWCWSSPPGALPPAPQLNLVLRTGQSITLAPGDTRTLADVAILGGAGTDDSRRCGFSDSGGLALWARFTGGSEAILVVQAGPAIAMGGPSRLSSVAMLRPGDSVSGTTISIVGSQPGASARIITPVAPPAIYRHRLVLAGEFGQPADGHITGLPQVDGIVQPLAPSIFQNWPNVQGTGIIGTTRFNQWYGFGRGEITPWIGSVVLAGSRITATLQTTAVTPVELGTFKTGPIEITTAVPTNFASNTELAVYDASFLPIPDAINDDRSSDSTWSTISRSFSPGVYYLALSDQGLASNLPNPPTDFDRDSPVLEYPQSILCGSTIASATLDFRMTDSDGPRPFNAAKTEPLEVLWFRFEVVQVGCNAADVAGLGGSAGPDGQNTADDLIVFLDALFAGNLAVADIAGLGGSAGADGQITTDDLIRFLDQFFTPCS